MQLRAQDVEASVALEHPLLLQHFWGELDLKGRAVGCSPVTPLL